MSEHAPKHFFEVNILSPVNIAQTVFAAFHGSSEAQILARIIADWISQVLSKGADEKPLCLNCDAVCHDDPSWSIAVAAPYAVTEGRAVVTAICPDCAERSDISSIVTGKMLELCGGGRVLQRGTS